MSVLLSAANPRKCESKCPFLSLPLPVSSQKPKNFLFPQKYNLWRQWPLYFHTSTNFATLSIALLSVCSHLPYQQWLELLESIMNISKQRRKRINNCDARRRRINHWVTARHSPVPSDFYTDTSQQPLIRQFHRALILKLTGWSKIKIGCDTYLLCCLLPRPKRQQIGNARRFSALWSYVTWCFSECFALSVIIISAQTFCQLWPTSQQVEELGRVAKLWI